jgi:hypothetical protein
MAKTPAWTRKEGKDPKGGLNAKGRASYNKANPGKPGLKAPQPEGGSRKKSFCARMSGMKKKLTSKKPRMIPTAALTNRFGHGIVKDANRTGYLQVRSRCGFTLHGCRDNGFYASSSRCVVYYYMDGNSYIRDEDRAKMAR